MAEAPLPILRVVRAVAGAYHLERMWPHPDGGDNTWTRLGTYGKPHWARKALAAIKAAEAPSK